MKKNIAMRVAAILFILTMISTCAFSTTFAKYVTSDSATDTARVAKWGVVVNLDSFDLYDVNYATDDSNFGTITNSVVSCDTDNDDEILAPGTKGTLVGISITGTPEVAVNVSYIATVDLGDAWVAHGGFYCPLEITVKHGTTTTVLKGTSYGSAEGFEAAIHAAINTLTTSYKANEVLSQANDDLVVSWAWAYEGNDDAKDTSLGDNAASGNAASISFSLQVTVTQID